MSTETEIRNATPAELRVMVAEALGWTHVTHRFHVRDEGTWHGHPPGWADSIRYAGPQLPDWPNDIVAAWELDDAGWNWTWRERRTYLEVEVFSSGDETLADVMMPWRETRAQTYATVRCRAWLLARLEEKEQ